MQPWIKMMVLVTLMTAVLVGVVGLGQSQAGWSLDGVSTLTSRTALAGNDFVDWGSLGPEGTTLTYGANIPSHLGLLVTVTGFYGPCERVDQDPPGSWQGNFAPGDHLLTNPTNVWGIVIYFSTPVFGVGAQVQRETYGSFNPELNVFTPNGTGLGWCEFVNPGCNSNNNADNSAPFLGVSDQFGRIGYCGFFVDGAYSPTFAINQLDIRTTPVPLPSTLLLLGSGLLGLAGWRRKFF